VKLENMPLSLKLEKEAAMKVENDSSIKEEE